MSRDLQCPLYQKLPMIVLRRTRVNILGSPVGIPLQKRIPRRTIIMLMWEYLITVPQKTCSCGTPRFRMSSSRNPAMTQSSSLTLLSSYFPDNPREIFSSSRLRFVTHRSLLRVLSLLPRVESRRTPSRKSWRNSEIILQEVCRPVSSILPTPQPA